MIMWLGTTPLWERVWRFLGEGGTWRHCIRLCMKCRKWKSISYYLSLNILESQGHPMQPNVVRVKTDTSTADRVQTMYRCIDCNVYKGMATHLDVLKGGRLSIVFRLCTIRESMLLNTSCWGGLLCLYRLQTSHSNLVGQCDNSMAVWSSRALLIVLTPNQVLCLISKEIQPWVVLT